MMGVDRLIFGEMGGEALEEEEAEPPPLLLPP